MIVKLAIAIAIIGIAFSAFKAYFRSQPPVQIEPDIRLSAPDAPNQPIETFSFADAFPVQSIETGFLEGLQINHLRFGGGRWALSLSKPVAGAGQRWHATDYFPQPEIGSGWSDGYAVTDLSHG